MYCHNRQGFYFTTENDTIKATSTTDIAISNISLDIVKYHIEADSEKMFWVCRLILMLYNRLTKVHP